MNFENMNPENRNNGLIGMGQNMNMNTERRNMYNVRCCSFCRQPGHTITTCNSERLREFEVICAQKVQSIDHPDDFKNWLFQTYVNEPLLLQAFVIGKYPVTRRIETLQSIDLITEYIFTNYKNALNLEEETMLDNNSIERELITLLTEIRNTRNIDSQPSMNTIIDRDENDRNENARLQQICLREMIFMMMYANAITQINEHQHPTPIQRRQYISSINVSCQDPDNLNVIENEDMDELCKCNICWDEKEKRAFVTLGCNHEFCNDCIKQTIHKNNNENDSEHHNNSGIHIPLTCALCRSEIQQIITITHDIQNEIIEMINNT